MLSFLSGKPENKRPSKKELIEAASLSGFSSADAKIFGAATHELIHLFTLTARRISASELADILKSGEFKLERQFNALPADQKEALRDTIEENDNVYAYYLKFRKQLKLFEVSARYEDDEDPQTIITKVLKAGFDHEVIGEAFAAKVIEGRQIMEKIHDARTDLEDFLNSSAEERELRNNPFG